VLESAGAYDCLILFSEDYMLYSQHHDILTPRLALIAITPETLRSEQACDHQLGNLIQCTIAPNWPPVDWEPHVLTILLEQYERHPEQIGWHRYIALLDPNGRRTLIGSLGALYRDAAPAECEVGYSILAPHEGKGLATEGMRALIGLIQHDPRITSAIAHTFPHLKASLRVMEKCGFQFDGIGEETGTVRYRLRLQDAS